MTVKQAIERFENEMINEIFHSTSDDVLQDTLCDAVHNVAKLVNETFEAEKKNK